MDELILALDSGHGLLTEGKRCLKSLDPMETREWVLNDRIARYIQQRALQYKGFRVYRVDDPTGRVDVELDVRCAMANALHAHLYFSVHHNAGIGGNDTPRHDGGIVSFCSKNSTKSPPWRDLIYDALIASTGLIGNRSEPKSKRDFYVLKNTNMPAVLVEFGFMDSPDDIEIILSNEYARKCGYAVADAIAKEAGLKEIDNGIMYRTIEEVPSYARKTIANLVENNIINGYGDSRGLGLTEDLVRILMMLNRAEKL